MAVYQGCSSLLIHASLYNHVMKAAYSKLHTRSVYNKIVGHFKGVLSHSDSYCRMRDAAHELQQSYGCEL